MVTAILDKILNSQFGRHFIFWVFLALAWGNVAQWQHQETQDNDMKALNAARIADQKYYAARLSTCDSLRVEDYKFFNTQIQAEKERRIKWTRK